MSSTGSPRSVVDQGQRTSAHLGVGDLECRQQVGEERAQVGVARVEGKPDDPQGFGVRLPSGFSVRSRVSHWDSRVVFPNPAGADTSTSRGIDDASVRSRATSRSRGTSRRRGTGARSVVPGTGIWPA